MPLTWSKRNSTEKPGSNVTKEAIADETASPTSETALGTVEDQEAIKALGYEPVLRHNRSMITLLFQSLAIAAIPYGEGSPLLSAIYGGGQLSIFVGWILVCCLDECIALSLSEIASRYPTSAGPYYWSYQLADSHKEALSFINGWIWLIGTWTITLSVNFGFASLLAATAAMYHPDWEPTAWQLLLVFYAILLITFVICTTCNKVLPYVDIICAGWTAMSILVILIALSVEAKAGRHSASYTLGSYDKSYSGWGGFTFFIGLLPAAYTFSAIGMITSMSEEVSQPTKKLPTAISLCIPVGGTAGLFFVIPICGTLPALADILEAPVAQALPYIFNVVMGSPGGGLGLMFLVLGVTMFCSISISVAACRTTWAFARDNAIPLSRLWSRVSDKLGVPFWAMVLLTLVQALLGLINLGSSSAFVAFTSTGVIALAVSYGIPITISLLHHRKEVEKAQWTCGRLIGWTVNCISVAWIAFEMVLFSMPTALPVTPVTMNYASVVFAGFLALSAIWYFVYARKHYHGPPASDGL